MKRTEIIILAAKDYVVRVHSYNLLNYPKDVWDKLVDTAEQHIYFKEDINEILEIYKHALDEPST